MTDRVDLFADTTGEKLLEGIAIVADQDLVVSVAPRPLLAAGKLHYGDNEVSFKSALPQHPIVQTQLIRILDFPVFGVMVTAFAGNTQSAEAGTGHRLQAWVPVTIQDPAASARQIPTDWQQIVND